MQDFTGLSTLPASQTECKIRAVQLVDECLAKIRPGLVTLVYGVLWGRITPLGVLRLEQELFQAVRELGRLLIEAAFNALEPQDGCDQVRRVRLDGSDYRMRTEKSRNANVVTRFGRITVWRRIYDDTERVERSIVPLEVMLGLHQGATVGLVKLVGQWLAEAGASQMVVVHRLRQECGVSIGIKRLRRLSQELARSLEPLRNACQAAAIVEALQIAAASKGPRRPVLAVGRDGITMREYQHSFYEVATAATISVFDRRGRRVTTVYLAQAPERGQAGMTQMLNDLLREIFILWQGPLPTLAYVADSGGNESSYFEDSLRRMIHPVTGKRMHWVRVVDYYHAAERIWTMAGCLFGIGTRESRAWALRMLKLLKKPGGAGRVLHSAGALASRYRMSQTNRKKFNAARNYIRRRTKMMKYADYKSAHIPLGSGITEAACKTIFTQRLKLSGMRWSREGAATILTLRTLLLSGVWEQVFDQFTKTLYSPLNGVPLVKHRPNLKIAA